MTIYGDSYQDRGMVKWAGMYLYEHTDNLEEQKDSLVFEEKQPQQTIEEISSIISDAILKRKKVYIQKNISTVDRDFGKIYIGYITGHNQFFLYVDSEKILFDDIRFIKT